MHWDGWSLARFIALFVALAYLLVGIQVTLYHYRQNFHKKAMWSPVILSPILFIIGISYTLSRTDLTRYSWVGLLHLAVLVGLVGFYYHFRGVGHRIGGYALRNFLIGPPVILPLLFTALGVLGIVAAYWE